MEGRTSRYEKSPSEEDLLFAVAQRDSRQVERIVKDLDGTYRDECGRTVLHYYATDEITKILS